jgi:hypothetical protein
MVAHGIAFPEFASVDSAGVWRFHKTRRSVTATASSPYCGDIVKLFRIVDQVLEEVENFG